MPDLIFHVLTFYTDHCMITNGVIVAEHRPSRNVCTNDSTADKNLTDDVTVYTVHQPKYFHTRQSFTTTSFTAIVAPVHHTSFSKFRVSINVTVGLHCASIPKPGPGPYRTKRTNADCLHEMKK